MNRPRIIRLIGRQIIRFGFWLDPFEPDPPAAPTVAPTVAPAIDPRTEAVGRYRMEMIEHACKGRYLAALDVCDLLLPLVTPDEASNIHQNIIPELRARAVPERRGMLRALN